LGVRKATLRRSGPSLRTRRLGRLLLAIAGGGEQAQSSADFRLIDFGNSAEAAL